MFRVTKEIHFCYGHRLMNYDGKCRYFHGHNGKVEVELSAESLDAFAHAQESKAIPWSLRLVT